MPATPATFDARVTQEEFGRLVGISQQRVGQMIAEGLLQRDGTAEQWLRAYCERLREQAAGRDRELTLERAALAREQRLGQAIKNAVAQGRYAPVELLSDVLATAAASVADRMDALEGQMRSLHPDLSTQAIDAIRATLAAARNEWARETATLVRRRLNTEEVEP